ncbi:HIT family protein [Nonomuraea sp. NPDC049784]|uniref:HIT family protein n=1 Tax=Nonomuraea sp. NPDC049784 TaxID=3154361 RepID=UPI0033E8E4FD
MVRDLLPECAFCAVSAGAATTPVIFEDPAVLAFFPKRPAALGHTLIIPRVHIQDLWHLDIGTAATLARATLDLAHAMRTALRPDGLNVINSSGAAASQTVFHLHIHLVPRWRDDQFGTIWPDPSPPLTDEELEAAADTLRSSLSP